MMRDYEEKWERRPGQQGPPLWGAVGSLYSIEAKEAKGKSGQE